MDVYHVFLADGSYDGWSPDPNVLVPSGGTRIKAPELPSGPQFSKVTHLGGGQIQYVTNDAELTSKAAASITSLVWSVVAMNTELGAILRVLIADLDGKVGLDPAAQAIIDAWKADYVPNGHGTQDAAAVQNAFVKGAIVAAGTIFQSVPTAELTTTINGTIV